MPGTELSIINVQFHFPAFITDRVLCPRFLLLLLLLFVFVGTIYFIEGLSGRVEAGRTMRFHTLSPAGSCKLHNRRKGLPYFTGEEPEGSSDEEKLEVS